MSRAKLRRTTKQQAKAERDVSRRAAAAARRVRESEREAKRREAASQTEVLGPVGRVLWNVGWQPMYGWALFLHGLGRLIGIDTSQRGPPKERPPWMPAPEQNDPRKRKP
jgi:hypothetical protein